MFEVTLYSTPTDVARAWRLFRPCSVFIGPLPSVVLSVPPLTPLFLNCWRKDMHDVLMFILKGLFTLMAVR